MGIFRFVVFHVFAFFLTIAIFGDTAHNVVEIITNEFSILQSVLIVALFNQISLLGINFPMSFKFSRFFVFESRGADFPIRISLFKFLDLGFS